LRMPVDDGFVADVQREGRALRARRAAELHRRSTRPRPQSR
jgi:hypothetical protein